MISVTVCVFERESIANQFVIQQTITAKPQECKFTPETILPSLARVVFQIHPCTVDQSTGMFRGFISETLDRQLRVVRLGRVYADQTNTNRITFNQYPYGVTVDDPVYEERAFHGSWHDQACLVLAGFMSLDGSGADTLPIGRHSH